MKPRDIQFRRLLAGAMLVLMSTVMHPVGAVAQTAQPPIALEQEGNQIIWQAADADGGWALTVARPDGAVEQHHFADGAPVAYAWSAKLPGQYIYELRFTPALDAATLQALKNARGTDAEDAVVARLRAAGKLPQATVYSGAFAVQPGGALLLPGSASEAREPAPTTNDRRGIAAVNDQVIPDDLIVQGSACVGNDCVNNESFGFDTIRLKENNTRIAFRDTSTDGFASTDWQLEANDSASGGANSFSIWDVTSGTRPFRLLAGAPTDAFFVNSAGKLGLRTATPVLDIHMATNDTPALRFEQTAAGGLQPQTWDVAGNEANFFVRDVTGGSRLPFRIRPGAPTSSLDVSASGNVGIGTAAPSARLHVAGNALITGKLRVTDTLYVNGVVVELSDINAKQQIRPVDRARVLDRLAMIPVSTWQYKSDASGARHMGPMAQHFFSAFGLGGDDKHIAALDVGGVLIAAVQEVTLRLSGQGDTIARLEKENAALRAKHDALLRRLEALEAAPAAAPGQ